MNVVANVMLKFAVAGVVLMLGLAAIHAPAVAAPRDEDCTDCPASKTYDSEEVIEKIRNIKQSVPNEAPIDVRADRRGTEPRRHAETKRSHESYSSDTPRHGECADCAPRRKYDSEEVVKNVRDVDHSRVINTRVVVPYRTRVRETNHLV